MVKLHEFICLGWWPVVSAEKMETLINIQWVRRRRWRHPDGPMAVLAHAIKSPSRLQRIMTATITKVVITQTFHDPIFIFSVLVFRSTFIPIDVIIDDFSSFCLLFSLFTAKTDDKPVPVEVNGPTNDNMKLSDVSYRSWRLGSLYENGKKFIKNKIYWSFCIIHMLQRFLVELKSNFSEP